MSTNAVIEVNTQDADRCNRQAHVVTYGTKVAFGSVTMTLDSRHSTNTEGFDVYHVVVTGEHGFENALFTSSFIATWKRS